jgi:capsular exopolysaccharide synthesis family protein
LATYGKNNYKLCVTSLDASEGKSTISSNIGIILAQQGVKTLLIDGDLRRGVQHNNFKVNKTPGLSEMLAWGSINDNSIKSAIKPTTIENLSVLTTGKNPENSQELIASVHFEKLLDLVSGWYDFVIIDSPPLQAASDAVVFAHVVDSYIAVVRAGKTDVIELKKRISEYKAFSQKIAGVILNMAANGKRLKYYKYSNYYVASDLEKKPVHV